MLPGTARKPASLKRSSSQPSNLVGTLSHQAESPAAPIMGPLSRSRNDSSTAFLSHWLTVQTPLPPRSATRALPRSSRSSAASTASRTGPWVEGLMSFRFSKASSMVLARSSCMAVPGCAVFVGVQGSDVKRVQLESRSRAAVGPQEACEIVGDVIDVGGLAALQLPALAKHFTCGRRHHQHGGHAKPVGHAQVPRQVLEHCGLARIDAMLFEEAVIDLWERFRIEVGRGDVEHVLEMMVDLQPLHHGFRMLAGAVGEDQLPARKLLDRVAKFGIGQQRR